MRIRGRKPTSDCSVSAPPPPPPPPPSSSSSSSSSYSSPITAAHSLVSSEDSSNFCQFSLLSTSSHRCHGLNLLVKAIHQVTAGSAVGVPYIQRRVTIRRRRRLRGLEFDSYVLDELPQRKMVRIRKRVNNNNNNKIGKNENKKKKKKKKQTKDLIGIKDSILQPWGRRSNLAGEVGL
ncbi:hypothetical protein ABFS83_14G178200 [Erythranthe nasuta]